jgi:hypothetical protein
MMPQWRFSSSHSSCDMLVGFSFGFFVAFTGDLFFGGMAAARVFRGVNWMGAGDESSGLEK